MKISFCGKMGSGKDISVKYLINKYGGEKMSFSKPLYDILYYSQKTCGFNIEKDRKFLQWIGTEWARNIDENIWIKLFHQNMPKTGNIYCSDVRFINEFDFLKKEGFINIKLIRNRDYCYNRIGSGNDKHISEEELDKIDDTKIDFIIYNNGTLKDLYNKLDEIIEKIR